MKSLFLILTVTLLLVYGCASNPIKHASSEQLQSYQTDELTEFAMQRGHRDSSSEVSKELIRRINIDVQKLIQQATSLYDFDSLRYKFQKPTLASKIHDNYPYFITSSVDFDDARRQWYVDTTAGLDQDTKYRILNSESKYSHKLAIGMTEEQVHAAIGFPDDINTTTSSWGTREQWVYGGMIGNRYFSPYYFYFNDGILTAIQN